jgi:molybdopterin-containing oxidoreductase family iron-sulfur binding subunit
VFLGTAGLSAVAGVVGGAEVARAGASGSGAAPAATAGRRWAMVVDVGKCLHAEGCTKCTTACNAVHNIPVIDDRAHEVKWIWKERFDETFRENVGGYANQALGDKPVMVLCNHCDNPPCARVCPTEATWKREDGIVMMDWHRCIGCRYCAAACPYGSRSFNWEDPRPHIAQMTPDFPTRTKGVIEKCNFCEERLAVGRPPACVEVCPEHALLFGDLHDPASAVRQALASRFAIRRKTELGTGPAVYYLV